MWTFLSSSFKSRNIFANLAPSINAVLSFPAPKAQNDLNTASTDMLID